MKNERLLLIDGSNFAHRAYHAHSRLSYKGESTSVIYGMPGMISSILWQEKPNEMIVVWDGLKSEHRLKLFPGYKGHRNNPRLIDYDNFQKQKEVVRKMLYYLGVPQVLNPQNEADDMIYKLVRVGKKKFKEIIIVSGDRDFNQLVDDQVWVLNAREQRMVMPQTCREIFGYDPEQFVDYTTLVGDTSDDIKGYPGIGPKKALELLKKYGSLEDFLDSGDRFSIIDRVTLLALKKRCQFMIDLRFYYSKFKDELITVFYNNDSQPLLQKDKFIEVCKKYNMQRIRAKNFIEDFVEFKLQKS